MLNILKRNYPNLFYQAFLAFFNLKGEGTAFRALHNRKIGVTKIVIPQIRIQTHIALIGENGYQGVMYLLKQNKSLDGLFICTDFAAIGALRALQEKGVRIPEDVSIIGYDNISISSMLYPSLTTVDQKGYKLGEIAANLMKRLISGEKIANSIVKFYPKLIVRESVRSKL